MPASVSQLDQLAAVNARMNEEPYTPDNPLFGELPDTWKVKPDGKGWTCRNYAVAKAAELDNEGWQILDLAIVLCYTEPVSGFPDGEYHAVLAAEAGGDTWILDNRFTQIYRWDQQEATVGVKYRFVLHQVAGTDGFLDISWA